MEFTSKWIFNTKFRKLHATWNSATYTIGDAQRMGEGWERGEVGRENPEAAVTNAHDM